MSEWINVVGAGLSSPTRTSRRNRRLRLRLSRMSRPMFFFAMLVPIALYLAFGDLAGLDPAKTPPDKSDGPDIKGGLIGREHRVLLPDFTLPGAPDQAAMRAGFSATQHLTCGNASASLVYRSDVIVFAAHELLDDDKLSSDVASCAFEVTHIENGDPKIDRYPLLLNTLDYGALAGKPWTEGNVQDWAVARLARPVPDIVPYRFPEQGDDAAPGKPVVTISPTTSNWEGSSKVTDRILQSCQAIAANPKLGGNRGVMHLDCDVGPGSSGGAVLVDAATGHPRYLGTIIAYSGTNCRKPGYETCFSIARQLDPDLVKRVKGTTALGGPDDADAAKSQAIRLRAPRDAVAIAAVVALNEPFPAQDDATGREVAALYAKIRALDSAGRGEEAAPLLLQAFKALHDPDRKRPEWVWLLLENGNSLLSRGKTADAFQSFRMAHDIADEALKPALQLRMGLTASDAAKRESALRDAYLAGGDALFEAAGAAKELEAIRAHGIPTTIRDDDDDD